MADVADGSLTSWLQTGGVLAFAGAVLYQLRELKPFLKDLVETLTLVRTTMAALLERERARAERIAAQEAARAMSAPLPETFEGELTGPIEVGAPRRTPPGGYSQHRPKTGGR
jgi:hypothetical protein